VKQEEEKNLLTPLSLRFFLFTSKTKINVEFHAGYSTNNLQYWSETDA